MSLKKKIRKIVSSIFPKGYSKEKYKLFFYNFFSPKNVKFEVIKNDEVVSYKTNIDSETIITAEALYHVLPDFNYYQNFYKVKPNDIVIDAGANLGHISIYLSKKVGVDGKIYAFEPDGKNIQSLKKNISLNKDLPDNIVIEDLLLWNENTLIDFEEAGTVGSSAVWFSGSENIVKKQAVSIDSWVDKKGIKKLDFIKMDIEGAEIEALDGCVETIKKFSPNFAIASYHIVNGEQTYIKVEEFFKRINYPCKTIKFRGNEIITFAGELN